MKKNSFRRKKTILESFFDFYLIKLLAAAWKFLFAKRTLMLLTKNKIRTFNFGPLSQICILSCIIWAGLTFYQSLRFDQALVEQAQEIDRLKSINNYFEKEFSDANERLEKVNEYLILNGNKKHKAKFDETDYKEPKKLNKEELSRQEKHTLNQIKELNKHLANIQDIAQDRIKRIEKAVDLTGLNMNKTQIAKLKVKKVKEISLNSGDRFNAQGGPLVLQDSLEYKANQILSSDELLQKKIQRSAFKNDMDYLIVLERLIQTMPLAKPMKNYYISSGFGSRIDPLTGRMARHEGLDFVGPNKEKIISPASGTVILAGRFSDYGNAIVIDHGFGITTRYGHLSEVKVNKGQKIRQGDIIALQGSTGRSTGSHLHYEVRYKNVPLNPRKFLEAGNYINEEDQKSEYVNS